MSAIVHDPIGVIHLIAAVVALVAGTSVLFMRKGTMRHRQVGYAYVASMVVMLVTAFMIYRLFDGWGVFHYAAVISTVTLVGGMVPVFRRKSPKWVVSHFAFMYWSVFGLYAAFASEIITRIPGFQFFHLVGWATGGVMLAGGVIWSFNKKKWHTQFVRERVKPRKPLFGR
ncbi:MAG: DUF2306 domain-containing protein [Rhodothermales bacterium]|nr:DUF2306 domain-containing protein [Rhodothermales bacterium]MBO6780907.1 DUF2306 domain-containing protein [Rhodothermales bacterium]